MDIKTDRPRFWASWFYPQSAGGICAAGNLYLKVPEGWFIPADALQGMVLGYLSHILADMLTPPVFPCSGHAAGVSACLSWFPKGQPTGTFYLHGIICLVGMDAPFITREQRCSLVIANDQYLADPVSSAY